VNPLYIEFQDIGIWADLAMKRRFSIAFHAFSDSSSWFGRILNENLVVFLDTGDGFL